MPAPGQIEVRPPTCRSSGEVAIKRDGPDDQDRSVSACGGGNGRCDSRRNVSVHREEVRRRDLAPIHSAFSGDSAVPEESVVGGKVGWIGTTSSQRAMRLNLPNHLPRLSRSIAPNSSGKSVRIPSMPTSAAIRQWSGTFQLTVFPAMNDRFPFCRTASICSLVGRKRK